MQAQESRRLPIFEAIHRKGIAEEEEYKKRLNHDRTFWRDQGMIDIQMRIQIEEIQIPNPMEVEKKIIQIENIQ
jgi:hypothetical protein